MQIIRTFKGHTALNTQSSIWVEIEPNENIEDIINLYSELQRQSKIIVSNKYELLSPTVISIPYVYLDCSIKTLESIKRIFNGEDREVVSNELKSDLQNWSEFGQNNAYFLNDALELGIPFRKIDYTVYTIGTGIYGKSFSSTSTRNTSYIGVSIAKNKLQS